MREALAGFFVYLEKETIAIKTPMPDHMAG
jgi:hypothetical protein